ncbi:MAG: hypothetical protein HY795_09455 [Desulfovibrio sp.]|nr:hypothetical protein [Desulfovibrio sp.]MBI4958926.1 hypothetical protein [Desulfovibrio sp.]
MNVLLRIFVSNILSNGNNEQGVEEFFCCVPDFSKNYFFNYAREMSWDRTNNGKGTRHCERSGKKLGASNE